MDPIGRPAGSFSSSASTSARSCTKTSYPSSGGDWLNSSCVNAVNGQAGQWIGKRIHSDAPMQRRRQHPIIRSALFTLAAFYALALGVYGAVAIPVKYVDPMAFDWCLPRVCGHHVILDSRVGWRMASLAAGIVLALVLVRSSRARRAAANGVR
jgi:hypothetical protein